MRALFLISMFTAIPLSITGCRNGFAQFYHGAPDGRVIDNYIPPAGPVEIYNSTNLKGDIEAMERRGYAPIGSSSFNGASNHVSENQVREQAEKLGAAAVLVSSRYTHTISGALPMQVPSTSTAYTTGNATVNGPYGASNVYGSATTTSYGSNTVMMPFNVQRSDFAAVYFIKRQMRLGVFYGEIDADTRSRLQTNAGALVAVVIQGSPAFRADILPGDIIMSMGGERVDGSEALSNLLKAHAGQTAVFGIDRSGAHVEKTLTLNP